MSTNKTITIETRENQEPLAVAEKSWRERLRQKNQASQGFVARAGSSGGRVLRKLARTVGLRKRESSFIHGQTGIDASFVHEEHHDAYKKPWCLGRDQFDFLLSRGLQPEHRVLDCGCGALRVGIWLIEYLEAEHYFGLDAHYKSLEAAVRYEIPLHGLAAKHPRLLCDDQFACEYFGESFDFILAFSLLNWLSQEEVGYALEHMCRALKPAGRIVVYGNVPVPAGELQDRFGLRVVHLETMPSKFHLRIKEFTELVPIPSESPSEHRAPFAKGKRMAST